MSTAKGKSNGPEEETDSRSHIGPWKHKLKPKKGPDVELRLRSMSNLYTTRTSSWNRRWFR